MYVSELRLALHEGRARAKHKALNAQMAAIKEQKAKMREAKIKALAGEEVVEPAEEKSDSDVSSDTEA